MEPLTLGVIVAALVAKAGERATERAVDGGEGVLRRLVARLRVRFSGDEAAAGALALVERVPDSTSLVGELAAWIDRYATADQGFRSELESLVSEARSEGVNVNVIEQSASGDRNVQVAGLSDSQVSVSYGSPLPPV
jgi:hypothetical protein